MRQQFSKIDLRNKLIQFKILYVPKIAYNVRDGSYFRKCWLSEDTLEFFQLTDHKCSDLCCAYHLLLLHAIQYSRQVYNVHHVSFTLDHLEQLLACCCFLDPGCDVLLLCSPGPFEASIVAKTCLEIPC